MANYTQLYIQLVFAVSHRHAMISERVEAKLYPYIIGIAEKRKCKVLAINGMPDHVRILLQMHPATSISDPVRDIKTNSSHYLNENKLTKHRFEWQSNYAAFSYSKSQIPKVKAYIVGQKRHHQNRSFRDELLSILAKLGIEYSEQYGFVWFAPAAGRPLRGVSDEPESLPGVFADATTPGYT